LNSYTFIESFSLCNPDQQLGGPARPTEGGEFDGQLRRAVEHPAIGGHGANGREKLAAVHVVRVQIQSDFRLSNPASLPALIGSMWHDHLRNALDNRAVRRPHAAVMNNHVQPGNT
jgi:hypothetical protein